MRYRIFLLSVGCLVSLLAGADEKRRVAQIMTLEGEPLFRAADELLSWREKDPSRADIFALTDRLAAQRTSVPQEGIVGYALDRFL